MEAPERFPAIEVTEPVHLRPNDADGRKQYIGASGLGPGYAGYFTMLLNHDGVKADTGSLSSWGAPSRVGCPLFSGPLLTETARGSA